MYAALMTWFIRRPDDGPVGTETCSLPFIKYDVPDVNAELCYHLLDQCISTARCAVVQARLPGNIQQALIVYCLILCYALLFFPEGTLPNSSWYLSCLLQILSVTPVKSNL
jgi:hypothetical protein